MLWERGGGGAGGGAVTIRFVSCGARVRWGWGRGGFDDWTKSQSCCHFGHRLMEKVKDLCYLSQSIVH